MASSDVDQKYLGRIASATAPINGLVSQSLFQILGISTLLARRLYRARRLRKLDTTRDTKSLQNYHHIIWLSREGLSLLEVCVLPYTIDGQLGPECQVLSAKLCASFYHIFCLFANNPPITQASIPAAPTTSPTPLTPRQDNGQRRVRSGSGASQTDRTPIRNSRGRDPTLRDPIASITSDASFLTNPYAGLPPGTTPPPGMGVPPGLTRVEIPHPSAFLLPSRNFVPMTRDFFQTASAIAAAVLPGAHPLRLSVAIEHAAFLWDCVHDHEASRQLARHAIRELRHGDDQGVTDEMFEDATEMVGVLGRIMRRRSWESTPRSGGRASTEPSAPAAAEPPPPPMPAFAPTVPMAEIQPETSRRRDRDEENIPADLQGGPVGGSPTSRRTSRSSRHAHTRSSGSRSTRETAIRTSTQPQDTPPRPPPKDRPSTRTTPASRRASTSSSHAPTTGRVSKGKSPATASQETTRRRSARSRNAYAYSYGYGRDENVPPFEAERLRTRGEYHYQDYPAYPTYPPPAAQQSVVNGSDVFVVGGYGNGSQHYGTDGGGGGRGR